MKEIRNLLLGTSLAVGLALAGGSAYAADLGTGVVNAPTPPAGTYVSVFAGAGFPTSATGNYSDSTFDAPLNTGYIIGAALGNASPPPLQKAKSSFSRPPWTSPRR